MPERGSPWMPQVGDRVSTHLSRTARDYAVRRQYDRRVGTVVEYQPGGTRRRELYNVRLDGMTTSIPFLAMELDPILE